MENRICSVEWCNNKVYAKGLCQNHYTHMRLYGEIRKTRFTPNEIVLVGDYAEIILCDPYGNEKARGKLDAADIPLVSGTKWCINSCGYVYNSYKKKTFMHNVVLGRLYVDHINGDRLDNRRRNLRAATTAENAKNRRPMLNSSTGFRGVTKTKGGKFSAALQPKSKYIYVGVFDTAEEAALAYNAAAKKHYGEFAYQNVV